MINALIAAAAVAAGPAEPASFAADPVPTHPVTAELVCPAPDFAVVPRKEWDEVTNRVEALWAAHTNRMARVSAAKAKREEATRAALRKPWRAPGIPYRGAPHAKARPR